MDPKIRDIAERKIKGALANLQQKFAYKLGDLHSQAVKAGVPGGSAHRQTIRDACETELRDRFLLAWEKLRNGAIDFRLPRTQATGEELKSLLRGLVQGYTADLLQGITISKGQLNKDPVVSADVTAMMEQIAPEIEADIDQFVSASRTAGDLSRVFLSHAAADAPLASLLKEEIERRLPGVSVFCASYPGDIKLGFLWSPEIQRNLQASGSLMFVATQRSIQRNWVWFESGAFWFTPRPIISCCFGDLQPEGLPPPLNEHEATTLDTPDRLKLLFEQLSAITSMAVTDLSGFESLAKRLAEAERTVQSASDAEKGWVGVEWDGKYLVCDGPIEDLSLIDAEPYQNSMNTALKNAGFSTSFIRRDQIGEYMERGMRPVFATDKKRWRKEVQWGDVLLVAGPPQNA